MKEYNEIREQLISLLGKEVYYKDQLVKVDSVSSSGDMVFLLIVEDKALLPIHISNIREIDLVSEIDKEVA